MKQLKNSGKESICFGEAWETEEKKITVLDSEWARREGKEPSPDLKALYISLILTVINSLKDQEQKGERLQEKQRNASPWGTQVCFCKTRLCPQSHPCPRKYPLVTVTHLFFISTCPAHGSYHLKRKSDTWPWIKNTHVNTWKSNIWPDWDAWCAPIIFDIRASVLGDKSKWRWMLTNVAYVCPWASHMGHRYLRVLEWDSDPQLGMKDSPRGAAWAGLGLVCCMELTSSRSASWIIISDIAKPTCWGDAKPIRLKGIKERLEQRKRAKMMWCNCKKHEVVSRWVFLPLSG